VDASILSAMNVTLEARPTNSSDEKFFYSFAGHSSYFMAMVVYPVRFFYGVLLAIQNL
jgi:hypothetical protein